MTQRIATEVEGSRRLTEQSRKSWSSPILTVHSVEALTQVKSESNTDDAGQSGS